MSQHFVIPPVESRTPDAGVLLEKNLLLKEIYEVYLNYAVLICIRNQVIINN